ncbi:MAG: hypothetical protein J2P15_21575, partial [Micromonosporaceae bacterium]|nr:hypothetical protein [Micromonosporaceae bacterium]
GRAARSARFWADRPARPRPVEPPRAQPSVRQISYLIPLGAGAALALPAPPTDDDLTAINAAAASLLKLLAERGLTDQPSRRPR